MTAQRCSLHWDANSHYPFNAIACRYLTTKMGRPDVNIAHWDTSTLLTRENKNMFFNFSFTWNNTELNLLSPVKYRLKEIISRIISISYCSACRNELWGMQCHCHVCISPLNRWCIQGYWNCLWVVFFFLLNLGTYAWRNVNTSDIFSLLGSWRWRGKNWPSPCEFRINWFCRSILQTQVYVISSKNCSKLEKRTITIVRINFP